MEKHAFEITRRIVQRSVGGMLPGPEVKGEPFWALMEIQDSEVTGTFYAVPFEDKKVVPLFLSGEDAGVFLNRSGEQYLAVRGISREHLNVLLGFQELGQIQLGICMPVPESPSGFGVFTPTAEHIEQMLAELGFEV